MDASTLTEVLSRPYSRQLLGRPIARFAYTGLDGAPRVVPLGFWWDGEHILMYTIPDSPKDRALRVNNDVALTIDTNRVPQKVLLVRGTASVDIVDGIPDEYLQASFKLMDEEMQAEFEQGVRGLYEQMARITIEPTWATIFDFVTRIPQAVEKRVREMQARAEEE